jgi:glycosyltransferase involved in cell wall biosynthesis
MVGRIDPWKGQDFFLRAFAQAFPHGPERAVLVGAPLFGEHAYATELRRIVANFGLESRVDFRGFRDDIWSELAAIDVLVHASLLPEPFGQVVLEGMAAGLPIISVDDGGPAELLTDRQSGRLFPRGDARALAQLMRTLRDDPTQCEILGRNAREAAKRYDPASIARKLEDVYREVLL